MDAATAREEMLTTAGEFGTALGLRFRGLVQSDDAIMRSVEKIADALLIVTERYSEIFAGYNEVLETHGKMLAAQAQRITQLEDLLEDEGFDIPRP